MTPNDTPQFLTPAEAASLLRISVRFIRTAISNGVLPARRLGPRTIRISTADLLAWRTSWPRPTATQAQP